MAIREAIDRKGILRLRTQLRTLLFACLGCLVFPAGVVVFVLTYEQDANDIAHFPHSCVDFLFWADLCYTIIIIFVLRGWRPVIAIIAIPLLIMTAWMTFIAGMWFTNSYL